MCYSDKGKHEVLWPSYSQLRQRSQHSRMVGIKRFCQKQKRLPPCVTHGICTMSTYYLLRAAPSDLSGQRRKAWTGGENCSTVSQEKNVPQLPIQSTRRSLEQTFN